MNDDVEWQLFKNYYSKPRIRTKHKIFKTNLDYINETHCVYLRKSRTDKISDLKRELFLSKFRDKYRD